MGVSNQTFARKGHNPIYLKQVNLRDMTCGRRGHNGYGWFLALQFFLALNELAQAFPADVFQSYLDYGRAKRADEVIQSLPVSSLARRQTPQTFAEFNNAHDLQAKKPKRSALMLDKLMFALEKAVNERREHEQSSSSAQQMDKAASSGSPSVVVPGQGSRHPLGKGPPQQTITTTPQNQAGYYGTGFGGIKRGNSHGKVYWRCYFNAVSCF